MIPTFLLDNPEMISKELENGNKHGTVDCFLCGLHELYNHIMASSDLFIYLLTRVELLSRGLVS